MKKLSFLAFMLISQLAFAQKYFTREGHVSFFSKTDVEDIDAHNYKASTVLDLGTGAVEVAILLKAFEFKKALMQEHFNENYVESDKYPKAVLKAKMTGFDAGQLGKNGSHPITVTGDFNLHGVSKPVSIPATLEVKEGKLLVNAVLMVKPADYNITIPKVVENNISKEIKVTVQLTLEELKR
jgi:polyisoprenoid-binding protein YceI